MSEKEWFRELPFREEEDEDEEISFILEKMSVEVERARADIMGTPELRRLIS